MSFPHPERIPIIGAGLSILAGGDWTNGNRGEGALLAGLSAAAKITGALAPPLAAS